MNENKRKEFYEIGKLGKKISNDEFKNDKDVQLFIAKVQLINDKGLLHPHNQRNVNLNDIMKNRINHPYLFKAQVNSLSDYLLNYFN